MTLVPIDTLVIDSFLTTLLGNDEDMVELLGEGMVFGDPLPELPTGKLPTPPLIKFNEQSSRDVRGVGVHHIMIDALYVVRAIVLGDSYAPARPIATRIDTLLAGASGAADGGYVLTSVREEPFRMPEMENGVQFRHLGGLYRIQATSL